MEGQWVDNSGNGSFFYDIRATTNHIFGAMPQTTSPFTDNDFRG